MDVREVWKRREDHLAFRTCPRDQPGGAPGHLAADLVHVVSAGRLMCLTRDAGLALERMGR